LSTSPIPDGNILGRLRAHAETTPDRPAYRFLRDEAGSDSFTFGQLDRRVRGLAAWLREYATPGDRAMLLYPPGLEFIEAFLACLAVGIVPAPAYPPRKNRNAERLRAIADDARIRLILTTRQVLPKVETSELGKVNGLISLVTDGIEVEADANRPLPNIAGETVAFLQYTSGSTGTPRGVIITHDNLTSNERAIQAAFGHTGESVCVNWLPAFHDMGLIGNILQPLYVGFLSVLLSPASFLREPVRWLQSITEYRATTAGAPNFGYDHCVRSISEEQKRGLDLGSWAIAYNGAEPVRAKTLDRFANAFASCGFRPKAFFPCYGLAEATLFVSGGPAEQAPNSLSLCGEALANHRLLPIPVNRPDSRTLVGCGQLAGGTRVAIVDPENCSQCPPGHVGEVWVASLSVAQGYLNRPEETPDTFQARLVGTDDKTFLRTGDLGFLLDGELYITGRLKEMIIIQGRNLYPQDIESAVENVVPFVKANTCAAFSIEMDGEELIAIVAEADRPLVQKAQAAKKESGAKESGRPNDSNSAAKELDDLVGQVRQAVSEEFEVPVHAVAFVRPGTFPRTSSGKVQRGACRAGLLGGELDLVHLWQASKVIGVPQHLAWKMRPSSHNAQPVAVGTRDLRQLIHGTIIQWLQSNGDAGVHSIDHDASFPSLGIVSVGAMAIAVELEKILGKEIDLDVFAEHYTINRLAQHLASVSEVKSLEENHRGIAKILRGAAPRPGNRGADSPLVRGPHRPDA
jgi:acyl-CoA synthetase (AMP-forming)/AMP-acid ligase II/acyl carrier protein